MTVESDWLMSDVGAGLLALCETVAHTWHPVSYTHLTLPLLLRHLEQRWFHTLQVIDGGAGFAAQQVAKVMAHAAVIVVCDHALGHQLLSRHVSRQVLIHQELQDCMEEIQTKTFRHLY